MSTTASKWIQLWLKYYSNDPIETLSDLTPSYAHAIPHLEDELETDSMTYFLINSVKNYLTTWGDLQNIWMDKNGL